MADTKTNVETSSHKGQKINSYKTTILDKNIGTNNKFYRKVAFLMYTEMVNFRPQS